MPAQINNLPPQTPAPAPVPQQSPVSPSLPLKKSRKVLFVVLLVIVLAVVGAGLWFVFVKNDKNNQNSTLQNNQPTVTTNSADCAYKPKQNYPENEGLYGIWRERARDISFDVYLPCEFLQDFKLAELGISDEDGGKVFLRFNRPEPAEGEDGLPDDSWFYVKSSQEPSPCGASCSKAGDSKFGTVYKDNYEDLYLTIGNSLIIFSSPPYDESGDIKPMLDIINSLQKVDPTKLEFFNG